MRSRDGELVRLLLRAGYVRQLGSGIYSLLPLGKEIVPTDQPFAGVSR